MYTKYIHVFGLCYHSMKIIGATNAVPVVPGVLLHRTVEKLENGVLYELGHVSTSPSALLTPVSRIYGFRFWSLRGLSVSYLAWRF